MEIKITEEALLDILTGLYITDCSAIRFNENETNRIEIINFFRDSNRLIANHLASLLPENYPLEGKVCEIIDDVFFRNENVEV
jgi:hypothetical protein